jgi:hypothetical protein
MNVQVTPLTSADTETTEALALQTDTLPIDALKGQRRRSGVRYLCQLRTLYNVGQNKSEDSEEVWKVGRVVDISVNGIALQLKKRLPEGTLVTLVPMISSWNAEWVLNARVSNVRPAGDGQWCAGCEFVETLTRGQLQIFLQNSDSSSK